MKKLALGALFVGLVACGGGKKDPPILIDSGSGSNDVDAPDVAACNPVTQTGCNAGERCTDVTLQDTPQTVTSIQCVPDGTVDIGGACTQGMPGPNGFDNCKAGGICVNAECKTTCDPQMAGVASGCDAQHSCSRYNGLFTVGGMILYGACDPQCDPLTQKLLAGSGNLEACGSPNPADPSVPGSKGCYRTGDPFETFSCAGVPSSVAGLKTDRVVPLTDDGTPQGNAFINGCTPGFVAFFFESSLVREARCTGMCAPGEIDTANVANRTGTQALAKLFNKATSAAGDGKCVAGKKGSGAANSQNCLFIWPFLTDANGAPGPSTFNETLGMCFSFGQFQYDKNQDGMITDTNTDPIIPDCAVLPKHTAGDTIIDNDAADFGCQLIANSQFASNGKPVVSLTKSIIHIGNGPGEAVRHLIR